MDMMIKDMRKEAARIANLEIEILQKMKTAKNLIAPSRSGESQTFDTASLPKAIETLEGEVRKLKNLEAVFAIVGTTKAGKSTTINAFVGTEVLPTRNEPMTALPTLIRHKLGQTQPKLIFDNRAPLQKHLSKIQKKANSKKYAPIKTEDRGYAALVKRIKSIEKIQRTYEGSEAIYDFLTFVNDLARFSHHFDLVFPFGDYDEIDEFPVIEVEFADMAAFENELGTSTLLDTPGPNEAGQSHLWEMLQDQLKKASAVLAIIDYTQLKTDSDAQVREELKKIAEAAEDRLFLLVNKFDQKGDKDMDQLQVRATVGELMDNLVRPENIFPISSRRAYLSRRALRALSLHGRLPDAGTSPWVKDFGSLAIGGRDWENRIQDATEVEAAANWLWDESLFSDPLTKTIGAAHDSAARIALSSAITKIRDTHGKMHRQVSLRMTLLNADLTEIERAARSIDDTLKEISRIETDARDGTDAFARKMVTEIVKIHRASLETTYREIEQYFSEEMRRLKKNDASHVKHQIIFDEKRSAALLASNIGETVRAIIVGNMDSANYKTKEKLGLYMQEYSKSSIEQVNKALMKLSKKLDGDDIPFAFKLPDIKIMDLDIESNSREAIQEKKNARRRIRESDGMLAWIGRKIDFFDNNWGYEGYEEEEKKYIVDLLALKRRWLNEITKARESVRSNVEKLSKGSLTKAMDTFFSAASQIIEPTLGDLTQSREDHAKSKKDQDILAKVLAGLQKDMTTMQEDIEGLELDMSCLKREVA